MSISWIIFLDRTRIQLYTHNAANVLSYEFPEAVSRDMEMISKDALVTGIKSLTTSQSVPPGQALIILSSLLSFEKDSTSTTEETRSREAKEFSDAVPFESVRTKVYTIGKSQKIVAVNQGFYQAVQNGFEQAGFQIIGVVPASVLGQIGARRWLDTEMGKYVLKNIDTIRLQSLLDPGEATSIPTQSVTSLPKNRNSLYITSGIFFMLLVILTILLLIQ